MSNRSRRNSNVSSRSNNDNNSNGNNNNNDSPTKKNNRGRNNKNSGTNRNRSSSRKRSQSKPKYSESAFQQSIYARTDDIDVEDKKDRDYEGPSVIENGRIMNRIATLPEIIYPRYVDEKLDELHVNLAIVAPMCTGKTYYSKRFGLSDIDESMSDKLDAILKPLRTEAIKTGDWSIHNKIFFEETVKFYLTNKVKKGIIFVHSFDHALALKAKAVIAIKLAGKAWNENTEERAKALKSENELKRFNTLRKLNYNSIYGKVYRSRKDLENALSRMVELYGTNY